MTTLAAGGSVPEEMLNLPLADATGAGHTVASALQHGPVVLCIYKSSCQASKTIFPFLERLHQRGADAGFAVLGVSQDSANITQSFARRQGATFPILIEPDGYPVSHAFDITATPTVYVIQTNGKIVYTTMGFFRDPVNELGYAIARETAMEPFELFDDSDASGPVFVPG